MKIAITSDFHIGNISDSWITKNLLSSKVEETFKQIDYIIGRYLKGLTKMMPISL